MAITARTRLVNPRLGTYFGIFTATFAALVLMVMMLEQLGTADPVVRLAMFGGPIALYVAIGLASRAREAADYFACGRRVPAFFNGLVLGVTALGGAGFLAFTGSLLIVGVDAMCLSIGWCAGLVFMGVLFAPFLRKFGAYTVPTFIGRRFREPRRAHRRGCRLLRAAAAAAGGRGAVCRLCRGLAARPVRARRGDGDSWLRGADRARRRHALADLVERRQSHRGAARVGRARQHRRHHGFQPAAAADDARQCAASDHARRGGAGRALGAGPAAGLRPAGRERRAPRQALHPVLRQRRQPQLRADVVRGCSRHRGGARTPVPRRHHARHLRGAQVARLGGAGRGPRAADVAGDRRVSAHDDRSTRSSAMPPTGCPPGSRCCSRRASSGSRPRRNS